MLRSYPLVYSVIFVEDCTQISQLCKISGMNKGFLDIASIAVIVNRENNFQWKFDSQLKLNRRTHD